MLGLLLTLLAVPQDTDAHREALRRAEAAHAATLAGVSPAVCAVMPLVGRGGGSGVVIDPAGFVLTNFHVVARPEGATVPPLEQPPAPAGSGRTLRYSERPADEDTDDPAWSVVRVGSPDGELWLADVLGIDPGSDLALLRLRPAGGRTRFPWAPLGDSDALLVGETVFALGNPFALANDFRPAVTRGIVSGTHRYQPGGAQRFLVYPDCIQIDAPINPGNSGGPLVNTAGEVVGINGRISVRERGRVNTGVGFAIASAQIRNFLPDLMAGHHVEHGTLDLNAWFMEAPGGGRHGVFVQSLFVDSVAGEHGIGLGDELTSFQGVAVRSANQLATMVGVLPAGAWVTVGHRPRLRAGGFGPERQVTLPLTRLDTGSSLDPDRRATEAQRRLAAAAALARMDTAAPPGGVRLELTAADGRVRVLERRGRALRWEQDGAAAVLPEDGEPFVVEGARARAATAAETSRLGAMLRNPALWAGPPPMLGDGAVLEGGAFVFGAPAWRLRGAGSTAEIWLYGDGTPAGLAFDDGVRGVRVELRLARDGRARWMLGGELDGGWTMRASDELPEPARFWRPER